MKNNVISNVRDSIIIQGSDNQVSLSSASTPSNIADNQLSSGANSKGVSTRKDFDVFVSHAQEDKDEIVRPLAYALRKEGLAVWYDEFELKIGDSLRQNIDHGLARSRFGVIVLSEAFFSKKWTKWELDGLLSKAISNEHSEILFPIWHKVTKEQVIRASPSLADKLSRSTETCTVTEIASEIAEIVRAK